MAQQEAQVKEHEPSIEEILASIQKIIAEGDEAAATAKRTNQGSPFEEEEDILDLTERIMEPEPEPEISEPVQEIDNSLLQQTPPEDDIDLAFIAPTEPYPEPYMPPLEEPYTPDLPPSAALLSPGTEGAARSALERLAAHMVVARAPGRTLEDMVEDILTPMLREWLDAHLPALIERLVREEIERITRRQ